MLLFVLPSAAASSFGQPSCHQGSGYQEIVGDFQASSLFGNQLLPPAQALTTPQYLLIAGKVYFNQDYTFAPGSDIIFLDNDSGFKIIGNVELTLNGAHLRGCERLWIGVEVLDEGKLTALNSTFEDAKTAVLLRNGSIIRITGNTFNKNVCGILASRSTSGATTPISIALGSADGLSGNTFSGDAPLLEAISPAAMASGLINAPSAMTDYPYAGIWLQRVSALSIGHDGYNVNMFHDFGQHQETGISTRGLISIESNITVSNAAFDNFGIYDPSFPPNNNVSFAIYALNNVMTPTETTVSSSTFSKCYIDIRTRGTDIKVTGIDSYHAFGSISASPANSLQNPYICSITDNKIDNFHGVGMQIFLRQASGSLNISNNLIADNAQPYTFGLFNRFGIVVENDGPAPEINMNGSRIFNNKLWSRSGFTGRFHGIGIGKMSYLTIEQNSVQEMSSTSALDAFFGIRVLEYPCNGTRVLYNNFKGSGINYPSFAAGTFFSESINGIFRCNATDKLNTGMAFFDNCDNTDLRENEFFYHERGLALGHPNVNVTSGGLVHRIGQQTNKENRWYGTNSIVEAYAINQASALASIFEINSSNLNSFFWPFPRKIGTVDDNFTWFLPSPTGPEADESVVACFLVAPDPKFESRLADNDEMLLAGEYQPPLGYPALEWEARWQFADRLNRNPALQSISAEAAQYYQDTYNEAYSSLNRTYQGYLNRWQPESAQAELVQGYMASLREAVAQRFALDALLSPSPEENTALHQQMQAADSAIAIQTALLEEAIELLHMEIDQQMSVLLAGVASITATEPYEADMKEVIEILLSAHLAGGELTSEQADRVAAIADKCRYAGGYAVLLARTFFEQQESYAQDLDCEAAQLSIAPSSEVPNASSLRVFPNPASEALTIQTGQDFERGTARLFNAQGLLLKQFELQYRNTSISVNELGSGMYFLEVQLDGQPKLHKAFIVAK
jgi:hypothetical protein